MLLTTDPRPAIAVALVAANVGIERVGSGRPALTMLMLMLTTAAPVVLALTVARTRRLVKATNGTARPYRSVIRRSCGPAASA